MTETRGLNTLDLANLIAHREIDNPYPKGSLSEKILNLVVKQTRHNSYLNTTRFRIEMPLMNGESHSEDKSVEYLEEICNNFGGLFDVATIRSTKDRYLFECTKIHVGFDHMKRELNKALQELDYDE